VKKVFKKNKHGEEIVAKGSRCPFCDGKWFSFREYSTGICFNVECVSCGAVGPLGETKEEAEQLWMDRKSESAEKENSIWNLG